MNEYGRNRIPFVFIIDFDMNNPLVFRVDELEENDVWISIPTYSNRNSTEGNIDFVFQKFPVEFDQYQKAYNIAKEAIIRGDTFLLNLTFPTNLRTSLSLDEIYGHGKAKYKLRYKDQFVVFSPEPFIGIQGNKISSFPMKGTMDLAIKDAEKRLMEDIKEISEHNTIVDLIRNDLSMVAKRVRVERFRYIERIKTHEKELLQTSSEITGELPKNWNENLGGILFRLLPAGSISGAPKKKTVEIIHEAEKYDRGYFTGVFGHFDGMSLDSAVMIRYIEKQEDSLVFKSGGGITYFSNCEQEFQELIDKVYVPII
ncbi:MAG: aminodeoxychorismate synthase component I [Bacteroidales bacterium]